MAVHWPAHHLKKPQHFGRDIGCDIGCDFGCDFRRACWEHVGYLRGGMSGSAVRRVFDWTRKRRRHPILGDVDQRLGDLVVGAQLVNASHATVGLLDQPHAVQHAEQEGIPRDAFRAQVLFMHACWQTTRRHVSNVIEN